MTVTQSFYYAEGQTDMLIRRRLMLDEAEDAALCEAATNDMRTPSDQARYMLCQELIRRKLLSARLRLSDLDITRGGLLSLEQQVEQEEDSDGKAAVACS